MMFSGSHLSVLFLLCLGMIMTVRSEEQEQPTGAARADDELRAMMKRFYAWEDAKRSFDSVYGPKNIGEKRKQFYAWAGKRSDGAMDKRKQFYAWAGRK